MQKDTLLGDRYRLTRRLGSGGMAAVWAADDERLDRQVAVKILSDTLASDRDYVKRFDREARTAAGLSHPNLVGIYDYGSDDERPYLVMDLVEGPSLAELLGSRRRRRPDPERLARELLEALAHIHGAGILHRDIKPGNVLIDKDGRARLTDFGIAQPRDASRLTKTGHVIGTQDYMAPEVAKGKNASERSDLYSLGVLLAEVCKDSPPPSLEGLIDRLTREAPRERPASAEAAEKLIGAGAATVPAGGSEATTRRLPWTSKTVPLPRSRRGAAGAGAGAGAGPGGSGPPRRALLGLAALALIVGVIALASMGGGDDSTEPDPTTTSKPETQPEPEPAPAPAPEPAPVEEEGGGPTPDKGPPGHAKGNGKGKGKGPK